MYDIYVSQQSTTVLPNNVGKTLLSSISLMIWLCLIKSVVCINIISFLKVSRNYSLFFNLLRMGILVLISLLHLITLPWNDFSCVLRSNEGEHFSR